jgi:hypothetical protein
MPGEPKPRSNPRGWGGGKSNTDMRVRKMQPLKRHIALSCCVVLSCLCSMTCGLVLSSCHFVLSRSMLSCVVLSCVVLSCGCCLVIVLSCLILCFFGLVYGYFVLSCVCDVCIVLCCLVLP